MRGSLLAEELEEDELSELVDLLDAYGMSDTIISSCPHVYWGVFPRTTYR